MVTILTGIQLKEYFLTIFFLSFNDVDKRQWMAIGILSAILFIVIILFIIL